MLRREIEATSSSLDTHGVPERRRMRKIIIIIVVTSVMVVIPSWGGIHFSCVMELIPSCNGVISSG